MFPPGALLRASTSVLEILVRNWMRVEVILVHDIWFNEVSAAGGVLEEKHARC